MQRIMRGHITQTWIILLVLTMLTMGAGYRSSLGLVGDAAIMIITLIKGRQLLVHFLEIRRSRFGWLFLFSLWLVIVSVANWGAANMVHFLVR